MAARIVQKQWDLLKQGFDEQPGNYAHAARVASVDERTAKKAWTTGWAATATKPAFEALEKVITEEKIKARALLQAEAAARKASSEKEREEARKSAVQTKAQEGQIVQFSRAQSLQNLTAAIELSRQVRAFTAGDPPTAQNPRPAAGPLKQRLDLEKEKIIKWVQYETDIMNGVATAVAPTFAKPPMSIQDLTILIERITLLNARIVNTARQAMEMERLYLGEPTTIIGFADENREITVEEAAIRREAANAALDGAFKAGGLRVLAGGRKDPIVGQRVNKVP